jgi:ribosomal protein S18 acetylase RimI-like enzyme
VLRSLLQWIFGCSHSNHLRGKGIGRELLARLLQEADAAGIEEIWGSVMPADIDGTPYLLAWYQRCGFVATEPDGECVRGAAKKIVRRRPISPP